jgi:hypothetical protein
VTATRRPLYLITLQGRGTDDIRRLRRMLKALGRRGLRCIAACETTSTNCTLPVADFRHRRRAFTRGRGGGHRRAQMSIGKRKTGGGNFLPRFKINGLTAAMFLLDRVYTKGKGYDTESRNVPYGKFRATFDMANVERGYADFTGRVPDLVFSPLGKDIGEPPSKKHKEGNRVLMLMDATLGGTVRELISTASGVYYSFDTLHDDYIAGLDDR